MASRRPTVQGAGQRRMALLFAGQGAHRVGMGMPYAQGPRDTPAWMMWHKAQDALLDVGVNLTTLVRDNPPSVSLSRGRGTFRHPGGVMTNVTCFTQPCMLAVQLAALEHLRSESTRVNASSTSSLPHFVRDSFDVVAGHSLGEFSALAALGVLTPEAAVKLVHRRGRIMLDALQPLTTRSDPKGPAPYPLYVVNPRRSGLVPSSVAENSGSGRDESDDADALVLQTIELIAQARRGSPHAMLELANHNARGEQLVVAGDRLSMAALGKCLSHQWRVTVANELLHRDSASSIEAGDEATLPVADMVALAVAEAQEDAQLGVPADPNRPDPPPHVPGSRRRARKGTLGQEQYATIDGGLTPPEERLTSLSGQGDGRSGLKRRSWFMPLENLSVPFHTSALRLGLDPLHTELLTALPSDAAIREALQPGGARRARWFTNATASPFDADSSEFRMDVKAAVSGMNVGEMPDVGRAAPQCMERLLQACDGGDARELLAAVCAIQLVRTVQWSSISEQLVQHDDDDDDMRQLRVVEVSPKATLAPLLTSRKLQPKMSKDVTAVTIPAEDVRKASPWF